LSIIIIIIIPWIASHELLLVINPSGYVREYELDLIYAIQLNNKILDVTMDRKTIAVSL
jgi:hypothetical protein